MHNNCGATPGGKRFQEVDGVDDEGLFVQWVRLSAFHPGRRGPLEN